MFNMKTHKLMLWMTLLAFLAVGAVGCGDDDDNPTNPIGGNFDNFDQTTAVAQSQVAAPQGVSLVESIQGMALGVGNKDYAYNEATQRWEFNYTWSQADYQYDWLYTVQYLDSMGDPQMEAVGAASVNHTMVGTADYAIDSGGLLIQYDYLYDYDTTITGIGTGTFVMTGSGGFDMDYTYSGNGVNQSASYNLDWATVGDGITVPASGCPTGTIRYDLDPYHMDLVFNGSSTATATLYDGSNSVVANGGGTHPLYCATK